MFTGSMTTESRDLFGGRWWAVLLRGLIAIAFGVIAFTWPRATIATLVLLFGLYALGDGIFSLVAAIGRRYRENRWMLLLEGIIGVWAGIVILRAPVVSAIFLVLLISIWAMATGFLRIVAAIRLRHAIPGEVWLPLSGVLSILFALMLMIRPAIGAIGLVWIIASYAVVLGAVLIMLGFELRHVQHGV
ncbi:MAG TPA: HdeD family acid-resistance protein [Bryobacteraceae bacterium]|nr:HdeD family acid-resistance protein [Bryobacteraceae bacterium]